MRLMESKNHSSLLHYPLSTIVKKPTKTLNHRHINLNEIKNKFTASSLTDNNRLKNFDQQIYDESTTELQRCHLDGEYFDSVDLPQKQQMFHNSTKQSKKQRKFKPVLLQDFSESNLSTKLTDRQISETNIFVDNSEENQLLGWLETELEKRGIDPVVYGRYVLSLLQFKTDDNDFDQLNTTTNYDLNDNVHDQKSLGDSIVTSSTNANINKSSLNNSNSLSCLNLSPDQFSSDSSNSQTANSTSPSSSLRYCEIHQRLFPGFNHHQFYNSRKSLRSNANTQKAPSTTKWMHRRYLQPQSSSVTATVTSIDNHNQSLSSKLSSTSSSSIIDDLDEEYFDRTCPDCSRLKNSSDQRKITVMECLSSATDQNSGIESFVDELCTKFDNIRNLQQQQKSTSSNYRLFPSLSSSNNNLNNNNNNQFNDIEDNSDNFKSSTASNENYNNNNNPFRKKFYSTYNQDGKSNERFNSCDLSNYNNDLRKKNSYSSSNYQNNNYNYYNKRNNNKTLSNSKLKDDCLYYTDNNSTTSSNASSSGGTSFFNRKSTQNNNLNYEPNSSSKYSYTNRNNSVFNQYDDDNYDAEFARDQSRSGTGLATQTSGNSKSARISSPTSSVSSVGTTAAIDPIVRVQALKYFAAFPALSNSVNAISLSTSAVSSSSATSSALPSLSSSAISLSKLSQQSSIDDSVFIDSQSNTSSTNISELTVPNVNSNSNNSQQSSTDWNGRKIIKNISNSQMIKKFSQLNSANGGGVLGGSNNSISSSNGSTIISSSSSSSSSLSLKNSILNESIANNSDNSTGNKHKPMIITSSGSRMIGSGSLKSRPGLIVAPSSLIDSSRDTSNFTTLKKKSSNNNATSNNNSTSVGILTKNSKDSTTKLNESIKPQSLVPTITNSSSNSNAITVSTNNNVLLKEQEKVFNIMPSFLNPMKTANISTVTTTATTSGTESASTSLSTISSEPSTTFTTTSAKNIHNEILSSSNNNTNNNLYNRYNSPQTNPYQLTAKSNNNNNNNRSNKYYYQDQSSSSSQSPLHSINNNNNSKNIAASSQQQFYNSNQQISSFPSSSFTSSSSSSMLMSNVYNTLIKKSAVVNHQEDDANCSDHDGHGHRTAASVTAVSLTLDSSSFLSSTNINATTTLTSTSSTVSSSQNYYYLQDSICNNQVPFLSSSSNLNPSLNTTNTTFSQSLVLSSSSSSSNCSSNNNNNTSTSASVLVDLLPNFLKSKDETKPTKTLDTFVSKAISSNDNALVNVDNDEDNQRWLSQQHLNTFPTTLDRCLQSNATRKNDKIVSPVATTNRATEIAFDNHWRSPSSPSISSVNWSTAPSKKPQSQTTTAAYHNEYLSSCFLNKKIDEESEHMQEFEEYFDGYDSFDKANNDNQSKIFQPTQQLLNRQNQPSDYYSHMPDYSQPSQQPSNQQDQKCSTSDLLATSCVSGTDAATADNHRKVIDLSLSASGSTIVPLVDNVREDDRGSQSCDNNQDNSGADYLNILLNKISKFSRQIVDNEKIQHFECGTSSGQTTNQRILGSASSLDEQSQTSIANLNSNLLNLSNLVSSKALSEDNNNFAKTNCLHRDSITESVGFVNDKSISDRCATVFSDKSPFATYSSTSGFTTTRLDERQQQTDLAAAFNDRNSHGHKSTTTTAIANTETINSSIFNQHQLSGEKFIDHGGDLINGDLKLTNNCLHQRLSSEELPIKSDSSVSVGEKLSDIKSELLAVSQIHNWKPLGSTTVFTRPSSPSVYDHDQAAKGCIRQPNSQSQKQDYISYYWNQNCTLRFMDFGDNFAAKLGNKDSLESLDCLSNVNNKNDQEDNNSTVNGKTYQQYLNEQSLLQREIALLAQLHRNGHRGSDGDAATDAGDVRNRHYDGINFCSANSTASTESTIGSDDSSTNPRSRSFSSMQNDTRISLVNHENRFSAFQEVSNPNHDISPNRRQQLKHQFDSNQMDSSSIFSSFLQSTGDKMMRINYDDQNFSYDDDSRFLSPFQPIEQDRFCMTDFDFLLNMATGGLNDDSKNQRWLLQSERFFNQQSGFKPRRSISTSRSELEAYFFAGDSQNQSTFTTPSNQNDTQCLSHPSSYSSSRNSPAIGNVSSIYGSTNKYASEGNCFHNLLNNFDSNNLSKSNSIIRNCGCKNSCNGHFVQSACCCFSDEYHSRIELMSAENQKCDKATCTDYQLLNNAFSVCLDNVNQLEHGITNRNCTNSGLVRTQASCLNSFIDECSRFSPSDINALTNDDEDDCSFNVDDLINDVLKLTVDDNCHVQLPFDNFNSPDIVPTIDQQFDFNVQALTRDVSNVDLDKLNDNDEDNFPPMPYSKRNKLKNGIYGKLPDDNLVSLYQTSKRISNANNTFGYSLSNSKNDKKYSVSEVIVKGEEENLLYSENVSHDDDQSFDHNRINDENAPYDDHYYYDDQQFVVDDHNVDHPTEQSDYYLNDGDDFDFGNDPAMYAQYEEYLEMLGNDGQHDSSTKSDSVTNLFDLKFMPEHRSIDTSIEIASRQSQVQQKPCTFYMEGFCARGDCKFSHDLSSITCKYWDEGFCFKEDSCPFLHGYTESVSETDNGNQSKSKLDPNAKSFRFTLESNSDFPSLSLKDKIENSNVNDILDISSINPATSDIDLRQSSCVSSNPLQAVFNSPSDRVNFSLYSGRSSSSRKQKGKTKVDLALFESNTATTTLADNYALATNKPPKANNNSTNKSRSSINQTFEHEQAEEEWPSLGNGPSSLSNRYNHSPQSASTTNMPQSVASNYNSTTTTIATDQFQFATINNNESNDRFKVNFRDKVIKNRLSSSTASSSTISGRNGSSGSGVSTLTTIGNKMPITVKGLL